jgi:hypothetical protein
MYFACLKAKLGLCAQFFSIHRKRRPIRRPVVTTCKNW